MEPRKDLTTAGLERLLLTEDRLLESGARTEYKPLTLDEIKQILENQDKAEFYDKIFDDSPHDGYCNVPINILAVQENKQLREQNLKLKIDLDESFGNSAKWKDELEESNMLLKESNKYSPNLNVWG